MKLFERIFGKPVWIEHGDGAVTKSRLIQTKCGTLLVKNKWVWVVAKKDGEIGNMRLKLV